MLFEKKNQKFLVILFNIIQVVFADEVSLKEGAEKQTIAISVGARESKKTSIILFCVNNQKKEKIDNEIISTISQDIQFTDIFTTAIVYGDSLPSKKELRSKYQDSIIITIIESDIKNYFLVRFYNGKKGSVINRKEYKIYKNSSVKRGWGHAISDLIVKILTGNLGFFSSKIAYCKKISDSEWAACVCDYDGSHEVIVAKSGLLIGTRWYFDGDYPALFFSKYTTSNIRLMRVDIENGDQNTAVSFEGLNMLPAFGPDGDELVVCLSFSGSTQLYSYKYDAYEKKMKYKQLTFNDGNNISPTIIENNDIIFCSDYEDNRPHLYRLIRKTGEIVRFIEGKEFAFSPVYNVENKKIVFSKIVSGVSQIFIYDFESQEERQVTFDGLHKQEPCWSPCGNYIAFEIQDGKNKRIAIQNLDTGKRKFITSSDSISSYPTWSVNFLNYPFVKSLK